MVVAFIVPESMGLGSLASLFLFVDAVHLHSSFNEIWKDLISLVKLIDHTTPHDNKSNTGSKLFKSSRARWRIAYAKKCEEYQSIGKDWQRRPSKLREATLIAVQLFIATAFPLLIEVAILEIITEITHTTKEHNSSTRSTNRA